VIDQSDLHDKKGWFPTNSTEAGIQIDLNDQYDLNDLAPSSWSSDLNSNAMN
jgi:hypothetical protein